MKQSTICHLLYIYGPFWKGDRLNLAFPGRPIFIDQQKQFSRP